MKKLVIVFAFFSVLILSFSLVNATTSCESAGYKCFERECRKNYEEVANYTCESFEWKDANAKCCKEVLDLSIEPEILLNKAVYRQSDPFMVKLKLPYFSDCYYYFIDPFGNEVLVGSGGCGNNIDFLIGEIGSRLNELFGSPEYGTYKFKVIAKKKGYREIVKEKEFQYTMDYPAKVHTCTVTNGEGECMFLGKNYKVKFSGCGDRVDLILSYPNGNTRSFKDFKVFSEAWLEGSVRMILKGAPCYDASIITLVFKKEVDISEDGTYEVLEGSYIDIGGASAFVKEISPTKVYILGETGQVCDLNVGETCKIGFSPVNHPAVNHPLSRLNLTRNLKITLNSIREDSASITVRKTLEVIQIIPREEKPLEVKKKESKEVFPKEGEETFKVIEVPEKEVPKEKLKKEKEVIILCRGCEYEEKCYPFGFRKDKAYCDYETSTFVSQKKSDSFCENNFECESNVCVDSKCISSGFLQQVINWFRKIFGGN